VQASEEVDAKEQVFFFLFLFLWPLSIPKRVNHEDIIIFYVAFCQGS